MSYSTITRKTCKCGCGKLPTISFQGYNSDCRPDLKQAIIEKQKRKNSAARQTSQLRKLSVEYPEVKPPKGYAELERWFKDRQKEMTGKCMNCGGKTEKDTKNYKCSIAHILPKAYFKSVATHPDNWIELCFYSNSCHTNFDNHMIDLIDLHCFDTVIQKFTKIYPFIAPEEKRRIPPILIEYLKTEI